MDEAEAASLARRHKEKFGGESAGEAMVLGSDFDVKTVGFSPKEMDLSGLRGINEERIAAVLNIPAIVLQFGAGLKRSTFANYKEAREAAYESFVVPMQAVLSGDMDTQLLEPDYGAKDGEHTGFDISKVRAFQEDQNALSARKVNEFRGGLATRNEARQAVNLPAVDGGDVFIDEIQAAAAEEATANDAENDANQADDAAKSLKAGDWAARVTAELLAIEDRSEDDPDAESEE